ncbi:hypothetical protein DFH94DRAFT_622742 [Russula ochroleuca]|uniref:Uncharacterized protein n=1 Tax=Russula ochroleuca TaxID=152965 RepID=A0A9P5TDQ3_9AGAM|nr:hypothetical protein DFH94DRAFT_622742 [Russula ochroleuca]
MAPTNKAQAAGVSSGSFLELRAQVAKQKETLSKGNATAVVGGKKDVGKKTSKWALPNKGVQGRAARDLEQERLDRRTVESTRAALERKAKIYEKLKKGQSGGLNEAQFDALLVDFDSKPDDPYESDSDDVDESLTVPVAGEDDDPVIEYEDEFGRQRTAKRSEVPRHLLPRERGEEGDDECVILSSTCRAFLTVVSIIAASLFVYNPVNFFPVYEPSSDRVAAIQAAAAEENNPLNIHYDADREVRAKGAGFYQFSADEETRKKQMEELRQARTETEMTRQELGAVDLKAGEVEGMQDAPNALRSRAIEKRKRELEERRRLVEAKRRKLQTGDKPPAAVATQPPAPSSEPAVAVPTSKPAAPKNPDAAPSAADDFLAALELDLAMNKR